MKTSKISVLLLVATLCAALVQTSEARQGATDPIPGTSNGGTSTGGGGKGGGGKGGSTTPAPAPAPAPAPQPIIVAPLAFASSGAIAGNCTGSYRIDPYYPTLSLMTVTVSVDSSDLADYSNLYVEVATSGGTAYPFTSNVISVLAGAGTVSYSIYVTPGTSVAGVVVHDAAGVVDFAGN